ncbi:MAG: hypothetical protein G01um101448_446 [Parcubacteria group bacterium Gr01-1014_48]|nr:MAG: hypothetical protein Greene041614_267 [Parcubacteria group bacterium Greene0416_14]TSC73898.1 MAG: hypothetical protein G01um101448_446 [Parcubacteria group bacterium Gr01-1014_48]
MCYNYTIKYDEILYLSPISTQFPQFPISPQPISYQFHTNFNFLPNFLPNFLSERKKWPGRKGGKKK